MKIDFYENKIKTSTSPVFLTILYGIPNDFTIIIRTYFSNKITF